MHIRKLLPGVLAGMILTWLGAAGASGAKTANPQDLYKQNCRVCHQDGSPDGEYSPMSLIQDQWQSFFEERLTDTHKGVTVPGAASGLLESLTSDDIKAIQKYCIDHAADSEQPQTCS